MIRRLPRMSSLHDPSAVMAERRSDQGFYDCQAGASGVAGSRAPLVVEAGEVSLGKPKVSKTLLGGGYHKAPLAQCYGSGGRRPCGFSATKTSPLFCRPSWAGQTIARFYDAMEPITAAYASKKTGHDAVVDATESAILRAGSALQRGRWTAMLHLRTADWRAVQQLPAFGNVSIDTAECGLGGL